MLSRNTSDQVDKPSESFVYMYWLYDIRAKKI